jgi:hypothetical protein
MRRQIMTRRLGAAAPAWLWGSVFAFVAYAAAPPVSFNAPQAFATAGSLSSGSSGSAVTADFNHDGKPDLAVSSPSAGEVSILLGNGDGTFQAPVNYAVTYVNPMAVGDFNGDGNPDLAVIGAAPPNSTVTILLGNGDGTFRFGASYLVSGVNNIYDVAVSDFNRDGKLDLAVPNSITGNILVFLGNGDGTFRPPIASPVTEPVVSGRRRF